MTTRITVDAHAGWPVDVYALDSFAGTVTETLLDTVPPGEVRDFYATSCREIRAVEARRTDGPIPVETPKPLDFAGVVRGLKAGKRFARAGWNGNGMFLLLVPGSKGLTVDEGRPLALAGLPIGTKFDYLAHVDMWTATGDFVPWICSQTDLLAEDWFEA